MTVPSWTPSPKRVAENTFTAFMQEVSRKTDLHFRSYEALYAWSIAEPDDFWQEFASFADIIANWSAGAVIANPSRMPGARFFPEARLNFAENLLHYDDNYLAMIFTNERGQRRELSYRQLRERVARVADGLRNVGVKEGDLVVEYLPNLHETAIAMLAATSLGAIWPSCSPDLGVQGAMSRFGQMQPKVLFSADCYPYGGKSYDSLAALGPILAIPVNAHWHR